MTEFCRANCRVCLNRMMREYVPDPRFEQALAEVMERWGPALEMMAKWDQSVRGD